MKQLLRFAAIGCSLLLIEAGGFKWDSTKAHDVGGDVPAHETGDLNMQLHPVTAMPQPTSPPDLKRARVQLERALSVPGSVCGYMSHDLESTLACAADNTCLFTTYGDSWVAGCCPTTSTNCPIVTTCIDSSVGDALTTFPGVSTYWCSFSLYPVCVTLSYQDVPGYTIYNCGGSLVVTEQTIDHSLDTSTSMSTTTEPSAITSSSGSTTSSSSTSTTTSPHDSSKPSLPLGAIIGGAVGGAALLALIIAAIIFLACRCGKKKRQPPPSKQGLASEPPPSAPLPTRPAMQQQQQYYQGGEAPPPFMAAPVPHDNRASIQKPPYDVQTNTQSVYAPTLSTPGSPPPPHTPSPGPGSMPVYPQTTASPPPQQPIYQQNAASQPPQQGQGFSPTESAFQLISQQDTGTPPTDYNQTPQQHVTYHEVSATRHDGELRELA